MCRFLWICRSFSGYFSPEFVVAVFRFIAGSIGLFDAFAFIVIAVAFGESDVIEDLFFADEAVWKIVFEGLR